MSAKFRTTVMLLLMAMATACTHKAEQVAQPSKTEVLNAAADYIISPGDLLNVFVWKNPELTVNVPVRPDGRISIPLVQDVQAAGKSSKDLAADIKSALLRYVKDPVVTVIVQSTQGGGGDRIMVIGAVTQPRAIPYRAGVTLLDVMVEVGGLKEFAAGNRAKLIRKTPDGVEETPLLLSNLLEDGDQSANVTLQPGDVIRIPERWF
jgi:polysaccharide export outer membrane protein